MGPLLDLLIAVIDQDRPTSVADLPPVSSPPPPHNQSADADNHGEQTTAAAASATATPSTKEAGLAVRRVSCVCVADHTTLRGGDGGGSGGELEAAAAAAAAGAEARRGLLQRACLRLFVTGMDLFFPSCAQRCSLLARYLSKYLR